MADLIVACSLTNETNILQRLKKFKSNCSIQAISDCIRTYVIFILFLYLMIFLYFINTRQFYVDILPLPLLLLDIVSGVMMCPHVHK